MEPHERLRLLNLEMAMQRDWLAAYVDDPALRAARKRRNVLLQLVLTAMQTRSLWFAAFGVVVEWWRRRRAV